MKAKDFLPLLRALAVSVVLAACSDRLANGGSGTGTGNSVTASLTYPDGRPAAHVPVRIRESGYLKAPPDPGAEDPAGLFPDGYRSYDTGYTFDGATDEEGLIDLDSVPDGSYVLEANDSASGVVWRFTARGKAMVRTSEVLRPLGAVTGELSTEGEAAGAAYVQVVGMERVAALDSGRSSFSFRDLPPGRYAFRAAFRSAGAGDTNAAVIENVVVHPGETTAAPPIEVKGPYPAWKHSATLRLNTTAAGAGVTGDVLDFPLLVRLSGDFPISQAAVDARDIRFAKEDGTPLAYEVERWDSDSAEIWVAMDTVYGNRQTQTLRMYWGNAAAAAKTSGPAVFDTAEGFRGVWHMGNNREGAALAPIYRDATANGFHGLDSIVATGKQGVVGLGQEFDGVGDYIRIPHRVADIGTRPFSVSLWVRISGPAGTLLGQYSPDGDWSPGENAFYFGDGTWITGADGGGQCRDGRVAPGRCVNGRFPSFVGYSRGYLVASGDVGVDAWHHLAMTWSGPNAGKLYLDGELMQTGVNSLGTGVDSAAFHFYLGKPNGLESTAYFKGHMDEVRICGNARDAAWIKLAFESQRPDSRLITLTLP